MGQTGVYAKAIRRIVIKYVRGTNIDGLGPADYFLDPLRAHMANGQP